MSKLLLLMSAPLTKPIPLDLFRAMLLNIRSRVLANVI